MAISYTTVEGALTGSLVAILTAPANQKLVVKAMTVVNDTAGALNLRVEKKSLSGGTLRPLIADRSLAVLGTDLCPEVIFQLLLPTGEIQASGNGLEYSITYALIPANA